MNENVKINVNGTEIQSAPNKLLIEACEDSGIHIPRFCWHKRLDPVGMCRMCLVEIETPRGKMLVPSCTTNITDDMVVDTESDVVKKAQEGVLEFLLINHPLDCPVCDKAGECPLQDQTMSYGPGESRFVEEKRHFEKPIPISEIILLDRERCILCARCTRFSDEISGDPLIEFIQRGNKTEVNTFPNEPFKSYFSGNTVQICPVGALTSTSYRFKARPWDLKSVRSTCSGCPVGCSIELNSSQNKMLRILGVDNDNVNQGWMCDKGRYNFEYLNSDLRLTSPLKKINGEFQKTTIKDIYSDLDEILKNNNNVKFLLGTNITKEEYVSFNEFAKKLTDEEPSFYINDDLLYEGFFEDDIQLAKINDLNEADTVVVWSEDLKENLPVLYLRVRQAVKNGAKLIVFGHSNSTLLDIADYFYTDDVISKNFEIGDSLPMLEGVEKFINDKNVTAIIGKSTPFQADESIKKLVSYLQKYSNLKILNAFSTGNVYGAFHTLSSIKNLSDFSEEVNSDNTDVLFVVGADPIGKSIYSNQIKKNIKDIDNVVCLDLFIHETSELGNYIIPTSSTLGEKEGTFTNIEFRTSRIDKLVPSPGQALSDWEFISGLSNFMKLDNNIDSLEELNIKAYEDLAQQTKPIFDNLDKPSNLDGILNNFEVNISTSENSGTNCDYFVGKKLYGDNVTIRYSHSISLLGAKQFIEANNSTISKLNLNSTKCLLSQDEVEVPVDFIENEKLSDGIIFIPINRRNLNKFDFSKKISITPNHSKAALNVN